MNVLPQPSPTALMSAAARAAHLLVDQPPHLLVDDLAHRLLGPEGEHALGYQLAYPDQPVLAAARAGATIRSRFSETRLAASACRQYVVLGAGLDTSAARVALPSGRRAFHVDLPGVLAWRGELLAAAELDAAELDAVGTDAVDAAAVDVPLDLATEPLLPALAEAGFRVDEPAFVAWLGVTMYLPQEAVRGVLRQVTGFAEGSELVLDHILPPAERDAAGHAYAEGVAAMAGSSGEPWRTAVCGPELAGWLTDLGWRLVTCTGEAESLPPQLWERTDALRPQRLVGLVHAVR